MAQMGTIIEEHEAPEQDRSDAQAAGARPEMSDEDKALVKMAKKFIAQSKKAKDPYSCKWGDYYNMWRGKQWKYPRPSFRHSEVFNMVYRAIASTVPMQLDARPQMDFTAEEPSDVPFSEIMKDLSDADWDRHDWMTTLAHLALDKAIIGTSISSMDFDPELDYGFGAADFGYVDPYHFFPDPDTPEINHKDARGCVVIKPVLVDRVKCKYREHADWIKPDVHAFGRGNDHLDVNIRYRHPLSDQIESSKENAYEDPLQDEKVLVVTGYFKPDEATEELVTPDEGDEYYEIRKKYPDGLKLTIINGILVEKGPLPHEDGKFPFSKWVNEIDPGKFWGISDVEGLEGPQRTFNKLVSFALDVATLMGNPIWLVHEENNIDTDYLTNEPGLAITWSGEREPKRQEGVQLQPWVLQMIDRLKIWFDEQYGGPDITRGTTPAGVTAKGAIEALQEASMTRVREKQRRLDSFVRDFGKQWVSRVMQYYKMPKIHRITGRDDVTSYFKFHMDEERKAEVDPVTGEQTEKNVRVAKIRPYIENDAGELVPGEEKTYIVNGDLDLRVSTSSSLPFVKAERESQSFKLFELGIIDEEEVLKNLDYPNRDAILERMQLKRERQAQAEAAAKQQGLPA